MYSDMTIFKLLFMIKLLMISYAINYSDLILNDDDTDDNNEDAENYVEMKTYGKDVEYVHFLHRHEMMKILLCAKFVFYIMIIVNISDFSLSKKKKLLPKSMSKKVTKGKGLNVAMKIINKAAEK